MNIEISFRSLTELRDELNNMHSEEIAPAVLDDSQPTVVLIAEKGAGNTYFTIPE